MAKLPRATFLVAALGLWLPGREAVQLRRGFREFQSGKLQRETSVSDTGDIIAGVREASRQITELLEEVKRARQAGVGHDEYSGKALQSTTRTCYRK